MGPREFQELRGGEGIALWFSAYLEWLLTSDHGRGESQKANNHGTWYEVQVASFALFVNRPDLAREVLEGAASWRVASQIDPDGSQPHELARTRSLGYSVMNLRGMLLLARLGEEVGVDLWRFETQDGRSIRRALDWLAPYADPQREWPHPQITSLEGARSGLLPVLRKAARAYPEAGYEEWIEKLPRESVLTHRVQLHYPPAH